MTGARSCLKELDTWRFEKVGRVVVDKPSDKIIQKKIEILSEIVDS